MDDQGWMAAALWWTAVLGFIGLLLLIVYRGWLMYQDWAESQSTVKPTDDGWVPTGVIDATAAEPDAGDELPSVHTFIAEDRRKKPSATGVSHDEIRWRKATRKEVARVVANHNATLTKG
jgi:hypothetical protein